MFQDNTYKGVLKYFREKLSNQFEDREIKRFCEWSAAHEFGMTSTDFLIGDKRFTESQLLWFRSVVKALKTNQPIQYILNEAFFYNRPFYVDESVLIPRPETEELVSKVLEHETAGKILDVGTGSGVIPITIKLELPQAEVSAVDVSESALKIAKRNAATYHLDIDWHLKDILKDDLKDIGPFDAIVSNPPYVLESDKDQMDENVLNHEPNLALFVPDDDPLKFYRRIVELSQTSLNKNGRIYLEIHESMGSELKSLLENNHFKDGQILKDLQGKDRIAVGVLRKT